MNLLDQGLALQAASIGKGPLAQESIFKVPCRSCKGFGCGEDQDGRSTGTCGRCDGTGMIEVKRKIIERRDETV